MEIKTQFILEVEPKLTEDPTEVQTYDDSDGSEKPIKVRLDKWLWAARFYKTRALARTAIENGKVFYDGQKTIPSREIALGASIEINQGRAKKSIIVRQLSTRRRSSNEAHTLFEDTQGPTSLEFATVESMDEKRQKKIPRFLRRHVSVESETPHE